MSSAANDNAAAIEPLRSVSGMGERGEAEPLCVREVQNTESGNESASGEAFDDAPLADALSKPGRRCAIMVAGARRAREARSPFVPATARTRAALMRSAPNSPGRPRWLGPALSHAMPSRAHRAHGWPAPSAGLHFTFVRRQARQASLVCVGREASASCIASRSGCARCFQGGGKNTDGRTLNPVYRLSG